MYTWEFLLKKHYYKVEFWDSKLSGKKKLAINSNVITEIENNCAIFNYSFQLDSYFFNLVQLTDTEYDLKINNIFFKEIINYEISGELKKAKIKRESERDKEKDSKNDNSEENIFGQSLDTIIFENQNNINEQNVQGGNQIINKIDFFPNDNNNMNNALNNNPLTYTFKDEKNNNIPLKETGTFIKNAENDNNDDDDKYDYPSLSEL